MVSAYYSGARTEVAILIPKNSRRILEIGCGEGNFRQHFPDDCEYWGIEPSLLAANSAMLKLDRVLSGTYEAVKADLPNNFFDLVVCNDVIEHMPDHDDFLNSIKNKMVPGGCLMGSLPNVRFVEVLQQVVQRRDWIYQDSGILDRTHLRFFTLKSIKRDLQENGFSVKKLVGLNPIFPVSLWMYFRQCVLEHFLGRDIRFRQFGFFAVIQDKHKIEDEFKKSPCPKVSVLIPTYNYARFLPEALDSILGQDFQDFEIIISDDASTDNTIDMVKPYLEKDARIHFFRHEKNLGMVENWNWCLGRSKGEYVKYLFADDMFASNRALTHLVRLLDNNPSAAMAVSARYSVDENSKIVGLIDDLGQEGLIRGGEAIKDCLMRDQNLIGEPSVVMFRKSLSGRGFDLDYRQLVDLEMWFHFCMEHDLVYTRQPLCCFRRHPDQQTEVNKKSQKTKFEGARIFQEYFPRLSQCKSLKIGSFEYYQVLFMQRKGMKKSGDLKSEQLQQLINLDRMLPTHWLFFCLLRFRLLRPFQNICRSFNKRRDRWLAKKALDIASKSQRGNFFE